MKSNLRDLITLFLGVIGLVVLFQMSQNGRYQSIFRGMILDTRNGKSYRIERNDNKKPNKGPEFKWINITEEVR